MIRNKKVALHSLGCKVNAYETEAIRELLEKEGFQIVPFEDTADIYIINTCTVTNIADRKSRQMLHRAKKKNPDSLVVAIGCYVQTDEAGVKKDDSIDIAIGNGKKGEVVNRIIQAVEKNDITKLTEENDLRIDSIYENLTIDRASEHTRSYIKIQDGCNQFCSYCAIPLARGRVRSRKKEDILEEAKRLVASGIKEIVVTGIHLCSYGLDFQEETSENTEQMISGEKDYLADAKEAFYRKGYLIDVIESLSKIDGLERIRLGSLEPRMITEEFAMRLKATAKVCPHFHLSLQSGCNETLRRMNRHYTSEEFSDRVDILRHVFDNPAITTDVIVGFPGETEEEFEKSKAFLEKINFYEIHVFQYSPRKGTNAAKMKDQIDPTVKKQRSEILLALTANQKSAFEDSYDGKAVSVLFEEFVESEDGERYIVGHTPEYIKVAVPAESKYRVNEVVDLNYMSIYSKINYS